MYFIEIKLIKYPNNKNIGIIIKKNYWIYLIVVQ